MTRIRLLLLTLCIPCSIFADGRIISRMEKLPTIPDQQAVLVWDEKSKTQTLAIETRFEAESPDGNYCWLIPTPGKPHIATAPENLMYEQQHALYAVKDSRSFNAPLSSLSLLILFFVMYLSIKIQNPPGDKRRSLEAAWEPA